MDFFQRLRELAGITDIHQLDEYARIGTAITKNSIPAKYKQYPVIGQGSMSVILQKDESTVYVLTRDAAKKDWAVHGLDAEWIDTIEDVPHADSRLRDMVVYVLKMPLLYPLSRENKAKIKKEVKEFDKIWWHVNAANTWGKTRQGVKRMDAINTYLEQFPDGLLANVFNHLMNYDLDRVTQDLHMGNFMQDHDGNIVIVDPIADQELIDILQDIRSKRYSGRNY